MMKNRKEHINIAKEEYNDGTLFSISKSNHLTKLKMSGLSKMKKETETTQWTIVRQTTTDKNDKVTVRGLNVISITTQSSFPNYPSYFVSDPNLNIREWKKYLISRKYRRPILWGLRTILIRLTPHFNHLSEY